MRDATGGGGGGLRLIYMSGISGLARSRAHYHKGAAVDLVSREKGIIGHLLSRRVPREHPQQSQGVLPDRRDRSVTLGVSWSGAMRVSLRESS